MLINRVFSMVVEYTKGAETAKTKAYKNIINRSLAIIVDIESADP